MDDPGSSGRTRRPLYTVLAAAVLAAGNVLLSLAVVLVLARRKVSLEPAAAER